MSVHASGFETELHITAKPVIAVLAISSLVLGFAYALGFDLPDRFPLFVVLLFAVVAIAWWLDNHNHRAGQWFTIIGLAAVINTASVSLGVPGILALMVIPAALAAAFIGIPAAIVVGAGETTLLVLGPMSGFPTPAASVGDTIVVLIALWAVVGVMGANCYRGHQVARWSWEYYERAQSVLEEARGRKAELEQALADLVHASRQLALANDRLAALRTIAEQAEKTKAEFVAKVSHEFRTPLNMIIGLIGLIVENPELYGE